jgi:hypothetical protein
VHEAALGHDPIGNARATAVFRDAREDRIDRVEIEVPRVAHAPMVADPRGPKENSKEPTITICSEPM